MTLGNSPQPLTRRQLRELAREQEPSTGDAPASAAPAPAQKAAESPAQKAAESPAQKPEESPAQKPEESSAQQHHSRHTSPPVERPAAARSAVPPAPLPIPDDRTPEAQTPHGPVDADSGRTLTRRELRALQAASSASPDADTAGPDQVAPSPLSAPQLSAPQLSAPQQSTPRSSSGDQQRSDAAADVTALHPPIGHWSVDREDDSHIQAIGRRDDATFDDLVGRGVGAGGIPTTTNALILPSIPRQGPGGPITSTGEIMITGSIDLPRSLGATGQHPNLFDSSEMDRMLDQLDEGGHHNDVAPVSASRAVSTHTSTRGVMTPPRKRGASLPAVLAITAAVLAIGVLSLFVVGYAFNIY